MATPEQQERIQVGDRFPVERLDERLRGPTVLYFYPADFTSGCTREAHAFNELYGDFRAAGVDVVGVSTSTGESHERFRSECNLQFSLVADPDGKLTRGVGLIKDYGEHGSLAARVTLLVDADGVVQRIWDVTDVASHADEVLAEARDAASA